MRTKQYSVKVCEMTLTNEDEFISFFEVNYILFKDHLIVINGELTKRVEDYLNQKELKFLVNVILPKGQGRIALDKQMQEQKKQHEIEQQQIEEELSKLSHKLENNLKVRDTLVRSGQELNIDGDLLLLNRVNSGATIIINGNLIITQIVEGAIRCNGNFMMIKASPKANIVFNDIEVDNASLNERLNKVEFINNKIVITPVLKETNWVS
ncbi:septum site-determining protein MinC [Poseidonibacter sp.]|uniref:septum site-determining protein MinC n=1 Tax=Poseidonibacter sp. TaxID=2321188 RepID=UPI00359EBD8B